MIIIADGMIVISKQHFSPLCSTLGFEFQFSEMRWGLCHHPNFDAPEPTHISCDPFYSCFLPSEPMQESTPARANPIRQVTSAWYAPSVATSLTNSHHIRLLCNNLTPTRTDTTQAYLILPTPTHPNPNPNPAPIPQLHQ